MTDRKHFIPVAMPDLSGNEERYVVDAIRSTWISSTGKYVDRFESEFASACAARAAIAVTNGTAALHLLLLSLGVGAGDEVIVPSLTFVATANAVRYVGAEPVFADIDPATWCIDPTIIESLVTPKTRGIIAVHLYGHPADMDAINALATRFGLWVIEDAAQAHGARYRGRAVGGLATAAAFSFYGNKILTSGEGGAITVNDPGIEAHARLLRGQGMDPDRRYYFPEIGYNYRLTNIACALLCGQLERADEMMRCRQQIFQQYRAALSGIPGIGFQPVAEWAEPAAWLFCITVDAQRFGIDRDALMARLSGEQIETRPFFLPIHLLPPYCERSEKRGTTLPHTTVLAARGVSLPTYAGLDDAALARVVDAIRRAASRP